MKIDKPNFYILTGGPGSGKTTLIEGLKVRGFLTVREAGRQILQEQHISGGDATHDKDQAKYRDLMFARSVDDYLAMQEEQAPVFFDRGISDLVGYGTLIVTSATADIAKAVNLYRYSPTVFIAPPWPEIYQHDEERKQSFQEAIATYEAVRDAYTASGYELVELPKASVAVRLDFVLGYVT